LMLAFAKIKVENEEIENLINNLEIQRSSEWKELKSKQIWEDILNILKEFNPVAYVRFASVYRSFDNLEDFSHIIE
jgi:transcriptional repressor NrdR